MMNSDYISNLSPCHSVQAHIRSPGTEPTSPEF